VGLDFVLADDCRRDPNGDCTACKVPEGAAFLVDSTVWLAFLDGVRGLRLAAGVVRDGVLVSFDSEAVIEERLSENIARWQPGGRNQMVFK